MAAAALLDDLVCFIRRFVVLTPTQTDAVALWVLHTYAIELADTTPYLHICSPTKRCGKSRLLETLELLASKPLLAANITPAALFRVIDKKRPTILFDEVDAIFSPQAGNHEDLRALLNAGYRRGTLVYRCVGDGGKMRATEFEVFCPKALAGIGALPDTLADRSLQIRLKRRTRQEPIETFRRRLLAVEGETLRGRMSAWVEDNLDALESARPSLPDALDDRAQDAYEILLAIADLAGVDWGERSRKALVELRGGASADGDRDEVRLEVLAAVRDAFAQEQSLFSDELCRVLNGDEEARWSGWEQGKGLTQRSLAKQLKPYGIKSKTIWIGAESKKGYTRDEFVDVWARYLPTQASGPSEPFAGNGLLTLSYPSEAGDLTDRNSGSNPHGYADLTDLTDRTAIEAAEWIRDGRPGAA